MTLEEIICKVWKQAHDLGKRGYPLGHIPIKAIMEEVKKSFEGKPVTPAEDSK